MSATYNHELLKYIMREAETSACGIHIDNCFIMCILFKGNVYYVKRIKGLTNAPIGMLYSDNVEVDISKVYPHEPGTKVTAKVFTSIYHLKIYSKAFDNLPSVGCGHKSATK